MALAVAVPLKSLRVASYLSHCQWHGTPGERAGMVPIAVAPTAAGTAVGTAAARGSLSPRLTGGLPLAVGRRRGLWQLVTQVSRPNPDHGPDSDSKL